MRLKRHPLVSSLIILMMSFGFCVGISEFALWVMNWEYLPPNPPKCIYGDQKICNLYQEYESYGYRLWPSRHTEYLYPRYNPRRLTVRSNKHGFRGGRELDEADHRFRIVILGDSFVFGEGVEEHERFSNVLEDLHPSWRVDNLGMTGWGPGLMLRGLEQVGVGLNPNLVVLCLYTHDMWRVHPYYAGVGFKIPRFVLDSTKLKSVPFPVMEPFDNFRTVQQLKRAYFKYSDFLWEINEKILNRFLDLAGHHNFGLVLVFLPAANDGPIDQQRRSWLGQYARENHIPFLDMSSKIQKTENEKKFIPKNMHYSPFGHKVVAKALRRFLENMDL